VKAAESARSHAYNCDAAMQQFKRRVGKLEADQKTLVEMVRQLVSKVVSLQASLDQAIKG
jgi:hypothetical protein